MFKGFVFGVIASIIVAAVAGYVVLHFGVVPANADAKPGAFEKWAARISLRATLERDAPKGDGPIPLTEQNLIAGVHLFAEHCAVCHGTAAGDTSATAIARGEYPAPPQLGAEGVEDDPVGWTYWKIKHGIRWTGMPAWKGTLTERQVWMLALFLKHMNQLPPAAEQAWQAVRQTWPAPPATR